MAKKISTHDAKTQLSKLINDALAGDEIIICRGATPLVRLVPYSGSESSKTSRPKVGTKTSAKVTYTKDAFSPMENDDDLSGWGMK